VTPLVVLVQPLPLLVLRALLLLRWWKILVPILALLVPSMMVRVVRHVKPLVRNAWVLRELVPCVLPLVWCW